MKRPSPMLQRPSAQVTSTISPEMVGGLLAVIVLVAVAAVVLGTGGGSPGAGAATSGPSDGPSGNLTSPSAGASPTDPSATSTRAPWAATAARLIEADLQLMALRDGLADLVDPRPKRADEVARALRTINELLLFANASIDRLEEGGLPGAQIKALRAAHGSALDHSIATLQVSVQDVRAYVNGGKAVLDDLAPLEQLAAQVAAASGLPAPPR